MSSIKVCVLFFLCCSFVMATFNSIEVLVTDKNDQSIQFFVTPDKNTVDSLKKAIKDHLGTDFTGNAAKIIIYKDQDYSLPLAATDIIEPSCDGCILEADYELPPSTPWTQIIGIIAVAGACYWWKFQCADLAAFYIPDAKMKTTHRPRFDNVVMDQWQSAAKRVKEGGKFDLRDGDIIHFFGESGAGKTQAAIYDSLSALHKLGIDEVALKHIILTKDNTADFQQFETLNDLSSDQRTKRNRFAHKFLLEKLRGIPSDRCLLVVVDEFQVSVPLCRGICSIVEEVRGGHPNLFLVFSGLALSDLLSKDGSNVSSDGSKILPILVKSWPLLSKVTNLDVAAQFVNFSQTGKYVDDFTADQLGSPPMVELLRMADINMAAIEAIVNGLKQFKVNTFDAQAASLLHKRVRQAVMSRNSQKGVHWRHERMKETATRLFDAAVVGEVPQHIGEDLSSRGLVTFEKHQDKRLRTRINGFYWATLVDALHVFSPSDPFNISPVEFELLALEWLRCRITAFHRLLQVPHVSLAQLIPGCRRHIDVPLPVDLQVVRLSEKLERGKPEEVQVGHGTLRKLQPPLCALNGDQAEFADGIFLLPTVAIFLQAKLNENMVKGKPKEYVLSKSHIEDEFAKAGFDSSRDSRYRAQRELHLHIKKKCGGRSIFVVVTSKDTSVLESSLDRDIVLINKSNMEERLGPFCRIAYRLIGEK